MPSPDRNDQSADDHRRTDPVDARRAAVARASTVGELLSAHASPAAFLDTPYGAAYLAHRQDVQGWSLQQIAGELGLDT